MYLSTQKYYPAALTGIVITFPGPQAFKRHSFLAPVTLTLLDPMTLICRLDLNIVKMHLHAKDELAKSRLSKVRVAQTDRCDRKHLKITTHHFAGGKNANVLQAAVIAFYI